MTEDEHAILVKTMEAVHQVLDVPGMNIEIAVSALQSQIMQLVCMAHPDLYQAVKQTRLLNTQLIAGLRANHARIRGVFDATRALQSAN